MIYFKAFSVHLDIDYGDLIDQVFASNIEVRWGKLYIDEANFKGGS
ncbi:hypothetical protein [Staphylococcus caeli]